jgi:secondary thiamine-phosphate synthase enzyme
MMVKTASISLSTKGNSEFHDITGELQRIVSAGNLKTGTVTAFCGSSTSALTTIEFEGGALSDLRRLFDEIVPEGRDYRHNARWGDGNGHSHVRAALLGPSLTIPVVDGQLALGTWQQVIHVDFDNRPRQRNLIVQMMGE